MIAERIGDGLSNDRRVFSDAGVTDIRVMVDPNGFMSRQMSDGQVGGSQDLLCIGPCTDETPDVSGRFLFLKVQQVTLHMTSEVGKPQVFEGDFMELVESDGGLLFEVFEPSFLVEKLMHKAMILWDRYPNLFHRAPGTLLLVLVKHGQDRLGSGWEAHGKLGGILRREELLHGRRLGDISGRIGRSGVAGVLVK